MNGRYRRRRLGRRALTRARNQHNPLLSLAGRHALQFSMPVQSSAPAARANHARTRADRSRAHATLTVQSPTWATTSTVPPRAST